MLLENHIPPTINYTPKHGLHYAKRSLISWVVVIPKEGWTGYSFRDFLVWIRTFQNHIPLSIIYNPIHYSTSRNHWMSNLTGNHDIDISVKVLHIVPCQLWYKEAICKACPAKMNQKGVLTIACRASDRSNSLPPFPFIVIAESSIMPLLSDNRSWRFISNETPAPCKQNMFSIK